MMLTEVTPNGLQLVAGLLASGNIRAVIDRTFPLTDVPSAIRYVESGCARGKVIIKVEPDERAVE